MGIKAAQRLSDISVTGAFIDSLVDLPAGSVVNLSFSLGERQMRIKAEVCHSMPQIGMGVRFIQLSPDQVSALSELVRERSE